MNTIYTIGYSGSTPDDLARYLKKYNAVIVDVRYSPRSRVAHWSRKHLTARFNSRYVHLKALGNENYRGGPVQLHDPQAAVPIVRALLTRYDGIILMCACRDARDCHRLDAAEYLVQALGGGKIIHLPSRFQDRQVLEQLKLSNL